MTSAAHPARPKLLHLVVASCQVTHSLKTRRSHGIGGGAGGADGGGGEAGGSGECGGKKGEGGGADGGLSGALEQA
eukprot:740965-Pleurochrysis_carterae.AAC.1